MVDETINQHYSLVDNNLITNRNKFYAQNEKELNDQHIEYVIDDYN